MYVSTHEELRVVIPSVQNVAYQTVHAMTHILKYKTVKKLK
jgi:hypothetical protein